MSDLQRFFQEKWDADGATEKLYLTHDLTAESVVFDVGGYVGEWTEEIAARYNPTIHVFEPIGEYRDALHKRFDANPKVHIHEYGLANRSGIQQIYKRGSGSSIFRESPLPEAEYFCDIPTATLEVLGVKSMADVSIDLMAINIEGGEYDLFNAIFNSALAYRVREFMVQFHPIFPDSYDQWKRVRASLLNTHEEVWGYPFVWEKWRRRD